MRRIKEVLRLKLDCGLSHRQIVAALGVSLGAVSKFVLLAEGEALSWAAIADLDEEQIEARLCPKVAPTKPLSLERFWQSWEQLARRLCHMVARSQ
ncbi:MAG: hypothetical protein WAT84_01630 [Candidatus Moraniibacteriota bacterium]